MSRKDIPDTKAEKKKLKEECNMCINLEEQGGHKNCRHECHKPSQEPKEKICRQCMSKHPEKECPYFQSSTAAKWEDELKTYLTSAGDRRRVIAYIKQNFVSKDELRSRIEKYKCDFNWDFKKNKAKHKSYIALDDILAILEEGIKKNNPIGYSQSA